jgi:RluA family pseudouridine synthase
VVNKPAGLPTQATLDKNRPHVYGLIQSQLRIANPEAYLALHHRLDKDTSGVLLFCRDKAYNPQISEMFKGHKFQKIYWALTAKSKSATALKESWTMKSFLAEVLGPSSARMKLHSVKSGGKSALTHFRKLRTLKNGLLIEAQPQTGRMHQIRVHLAESGLPILGDDLYNPTLRASRMMLHAYQLVFEHPKTGEALTLTAPVPADFLAEIESLK